MQNVPLIRLALPLIVGMSLFSAAALQAQDTAPATVTCKDGSSSTAGKGACSHHGGVNKGAVPSSDTATSMSSPAPAGDTTSATVNCKDGSSSKAGKGACSHHGGVNKGAAPSGDTANSTSSPATAGKAAATAAGPTSSNTARASNNAMTSARSAPAGDTSSPASAGKAASTGAPATSGAKSGTPTAKCKDGTMSYSKVHSGSCSHHGGVAEFLDK